MILGTNSNKLLINLSLVALLFIGGCVGYLFYNSPLFIAHSALTWLVIFLVFSIVFTLWSYKNFICGYLLGLFCLIVSWRIASIYNASFIIYLFLAAFIFYMLNFMLFAYKKILDKQDPVPLVEWQAIFFRMYIGLNFIPHFTEKLFAGPTPHLGVVKAFTHLGVPDSNAFVWFAGLCEFGAAVGIGLGFLTRIGALGSVLYLTIAAYLGHHFSLGFIWAGPGGGWEFTVMWSMFILSFVLTGAHRFSIDAYLRKRFNLKIFE